MYVIDVTNISFYCQTELKKKKKIAKIISPIFGILCMFLTIKLKFFKLLNKNGLKIHYSHHLNIIMEGHWVHENIMKYYEKFQYFLKIILIYTKWRRVTSLEIHLKIIIVEGFNIIWYNNIEI